jgi:rare lipoprotein A
MRFARSMVIGAAALAMSACASVGARPGQGGGRPAEAPAPVTDPAPIVPGTLRPYQIRGRWYRPAEQPDYDEVGLASWYGDAFHGRPTATGEPFDMHALTAAHKTLPLPGLVEVTNLANGRRVVLRINDRGPFVDGRIIDLSRAAADALDLRQAGVGRVRVRYLGRAPRLGGGQPLTPATAVAAAGPAPAAPAAAPPAPASVLPAASGPVWVRGGAFLDRAEAERLAADFPGVASVRRDGEVFRLTLGPYPDAETAARAIRGLADRGVRGAGTADTP